MTTVIFTYYEDDISKVYNGRFVMDIEAPLRGRYLSELVLNHITYAFKKHKQHTGEPMSNTGVVFCSFLPMLKPFEWQKYLTEYDTVIVNENNDWSYYLNGQKIILD